MKYQDYLSIEQIDEHNMMDELTSDMNTSREFLEGMFKSNCYLQYIPVGHFWIWKWKKTNNLK